jgi:hypothetical protein
MIAVVERKTTSEDITPGSSYWLRLVLDVQLSAYLDGAESLGVKPDALVYDVLRKSALRPCLATPVESRKYTKEGHLYANQRLLDETPEAYGRRVLAGILEAPEKHYQRQIIVRLLKERSDAKLDVWHTAQSIREARRLHMFPRNPDACSQWGRLCDYFPICSGTSRADDELMFRRQERVHEELSSDELSNPDDSAYGRRTGEGAALLTQSSLRAFRSCQRRYFYRYEERLRPVAPKAQTLRTGTSIHRALEAWSKTHGDLEAAVSMLDREEPFIFEHERALMLGYHARWKEKLSDVKVLGAEVEFRIPIVNPDTGRASRTFELGGKIDGIWEMLDSAV